MAETSAGDLRASLRELHDKGIAALQKNNLDYAIQLFMQVLRAEPGCFDTRQALRATQHRRMGSRSGGLFRKFLGSTNAMTKGRLALRSNPAEALAVAEEILNDDPTNANAHLLLADAALEIGLPRTAILSLEVAFKANPSDRRLAERLADSCAQVGQLPRAEKLYQDLLLGDPNDPGLNEKLKNILASRTLSEGGYQALEGGTGSYRDVLKDKDRAVLLEQEQRTVQDADVAGRLLSDVLSRLAQDPANVRLLREAAQLHEKRNDHAAAIAAYQQVLGVGGVQDPLVLKAIHDCRVALLDQRVQAIPPDAPDAEAQAEAIRAEREAYLLEDAKARADANPTDLLVRFELGELYFKANRITEAIAELQKAQNNPNRRIPAMLLLAQCFARRRMNDLAARKLQDALKEKVVFDEEKKDIHYQLGTVLEAMGRREEAIDQYKVIYESDISFRDVAAKVEAYYAGQG
jgi:tetratricopeptide (TPR) repeat protein